MNLIRTRFATKLLLASLTLVAAFEAARASAQEAAELTVTEIQLSSELENGQAVSPATSFARGAGNVYAVVRVQNPSGAETSVRVSFQRIDGEERVGISLPIPARPRYRTVARMSSRHPAGRYRVVVHAPDGREIGSAEFTVTE
jgi:hypothetical protein